MLKTVELLIWIYLYSLEIIGFCSWKEIKTKNVGMYNSFFSYEILHHYVAIEVEMVLNTKKRPVFDVDKSSLLYNK